MNRIYYKNKELQRPFYFILKLLKGQKHSIVIGNIVYLMILRAVIIVEAINKSPLLPSHVLLCPAKAETEIVVLVIRDIAVYGANRQEARGVVPTRATINPVRANPGKTPFPHIAAHVKQAEIVGTFGFDGCKFCNTGCLPKAAVPKVAIHRYSVVGTFSWFSAAG